MYGSYNDYYQQQQPQYGGINLNDYVNTAAPLNMPVGQAPQENVDWAYGGSGYNPYNPQTQSDYMDTLALTQQFNGTPLYQLYGDYAPQMTPEIKALWDKREAYNALSPEQQMFARQTGNGYFNNQDMGDLANLTVGKGSLNFEDIAGYNRWTDQFNDQIAQNILNTDNGNLPSQSKQWADATLNNKTWAASTVNDRTNLALPDGDQLARILMSQANHGVLPDSRTFADAMDRDFYNDALFGTNRQALQQGSGTHEGAGMAGQGSGGFQGVSMVDTAAPMGGWGNFDSGYSTNLGNAWDGAGGSQGDPYGGWGTDASYRAGYHTPVNAQNNSLLASGGNGITDTGINGRYQAGMPNGGWNANDMGQLPSDGNTRGLPEQLGGTPGLDQGGWVSNDRITGFKPDGTPIYEGQTGHENPLRDMTSDQLQRQLEEQARKAGYKMTPDPYDDSRRQNSDWYYDQKKGGPQANSGADMGTLIASLVDQSGHALDGSHTLRDIVPNMGYVEPDGPGDYKKTPNTGNDVFGEGWQGQGTAGEGQKRIQINPHFNPMTQFLSKLLGA